MPRTATNGRVQIKVAILAPDVLSAQSVRALLGKSASIDCDAAWSVQALERRLVTRPADALLWVARDADAATLASLDRLRREYDVPLCAIAERVDGEALETAYAARPAGLAVLRRGVRLELQSIFRTLVQLLAGGVVMQRAEVAELIEACGGEPDPLRPLSAAELAVLELVALGLRNRAIARRLGRSEKLVEKQVGRIFAKLGLRPDAAPDLDRRVTAARTFLRACSPEIGIGQPAPGEVPSLPPLRPAAIAVRAARRERGAALLATVNERAEAERRALAPAVAVEAH